MSPLQLLLVVVVPFVFLFSPVAVVCLGGFGEAAALQFGWAFGSHFVLVYEVVGLFVAGVVVVLFVLVVVVARFFHALQLFHFEL